MFENVGAGMYQIKIPFENIYTSAFILEQGNRCLLLDTGSNADDVQRYILPILQEKALALEGIICSHLHDDHCGGVEELLRVYSHTWVGGMASEMPYPKERIRPLIDGEILLGSYQIVAMSGHTSDCLGVLDLSTKTLLSCDSLQLQGVGRYPCSLQDPTAYLATIEKIRAMGVERIIASHEYEPLGAQATGKTAVERCLEECVRAAVL